MTTSHSPLSVLKAQADKIAAMLKAVDRGEKIDMRFAQKIEAARGKESIKFGVVMDDKVVIVDVPWATLRETSEVGLAEYILKLMRGALDAIN
jgi:hypothetical protein